MATLTGNIKGPPGNPGAEGPAGPPGPPGEDFSANRGYATTIGDGVNSVFDISHPLGTDVLVECVNLESGQTCWPVILRTNFDSVYLDFGDTVPAMQSRRVLISQVDASVEGGTGTPTIGSVSPWIAAWPLGF